MGEEATIFEVLTSHQGKAREEALKALQEHYVGKIVLRELMDLILDSEVFNAKAYVLDEMNRHHMQEEEKTLAQLECSGKISVVPQREELRVAECTVEDGAQTIRIEIRS